MAARTKIFALGMIVAILTIPAPAIAVGNRSESRPVDVVIALDTSGSMEQLIDAARARVWDVVNELGRLTPTPELRVGLLSFGNESSTEELGWIVEETDLTDDLDTVYGKLMALTTAGSEEHVGRVLQTALETMSWSPDRDALRIIFVAGNETADQGIELADFRGVGRQASEDEIIINALFAGNREQGIVERWHEVANHGGGNFSAIDPRTSTIQIPTPADEPLLALNQRLNETYVPYGANGEKGLTNQVAQDSNASRLGVQSCSSRIVAKGSALYTNAAWDLVDATLQPDFDWSAIDDRDLPEQLALMTVEQRRAFVEEKRAAREAIQLEIQALSAEREAYIATALFQEGAGVPGLGSAMRDAIRQQAMAKGFECDDC